MTSPKQNVWICLCQPSDVRNIGGAIRAVANFGLAGLKVVLPPSRTLPQEELDLFSSGAASLVRLERYETLVEATEAADLLIGTSRRRRDHSHLFECPAHELSTLVSKSERPHLLFGNERVGLSHHDLDLCHALVEIHSAPSFPSLNLAHAVACLAYEISRPQSMRPPHDEAQYRHPSAKTSTREDEAFLRRVIEVCEGCQYPPGRSSEGYARQLRSLIRRAQPTPGDYGIILGLFREIDRLAKQIPSQGQGPYSAESKQYSAPTSKS